MKTFKWYKAEFGEMNFRNVCRLYSADKSTSFSQKPPFIRAFYVIDGNKRYAVRWDSYEPNAKFTGILSCASDYFVLKGKSEIQIDGKPYNLETGNCYKIPKGEYELDVRGAESFEFIAVYELSNDFSILKLN